MGTIINPRGTGGSGKTKLVQRIIDSYAPGGIQSAEPLHSSGREKPMAYRLRHPNNGRPLIVLGHYERTSGGCDTIRVVDGGLDEVFRLADIWASAGHDVLLEGASWSVEYRRSAALAARHELHILVLLTPPERAARNLATRRRTSSARLALITMAIRSQRDAIEVACGHLRGVASIEELEFERALDCACNLLGLDRSADANGCPLRGQPATLEQAPPLLDGKG